MKKLHLAPEAVRRNTLKLKDELGRADRERLDTLLGKMQVDGRINLGDALQALYSDQKPDAALMLFRQYRKRLSETATSVEMRFSLEVDSRKRTPPGERWCWFEGEHGASEAITQLVREETEFVQRTGQGAFELRDGKPVIRYFISYAHDDVSLKDDLYKRLGKLFKLDSAYCYEEWQDTLLLPGDKWRDGIQKAIEKCHFGLLLVTPSFLGSEFITRNELPAFVPRDLSEPDTDKRAIPVALDRLLFDGSIDLKGLQHIQVFHDCDGKPFSERTGNKRNDFARQLFLQIRQVISGRIIPEAKRKLDRRSLIEQHVRREIDFAFDGCCFVPTEAVSSTLDKLDAGKQGDTTPKQRIDAVGFLLDWVKTPDSPPYFALLGELGMGKTTTCLAFARELLELRENDPTLPLPIYMDLRLLGEKAAAEASLEEILDTVMRKKWQGGRIRVDVSADEVIRLVQEEGALAIFDGLDEVLVHLTPTAEQRFLRELLRLLPPLLVKMNKGKFEIRKPHGRLMLSCRTHYFPTLRAQKNLLLGEDREPLSADDYRALVLMPFSEEQIIGYLKKTLPDQDPERVLDTIRSVHNLTEMAERPYTLSLIAREIPQIEKWKMEGRKVTGVTLYRHMVRSWLERDTGKHTLTPTHKQRLMEFFAAELWRSGRRAWSVEDVEQWLIDFLRSHPEIAAHYEGKDRELLKEDLRTATFLVREGEDQFRYAHTSLLEFFLACHLHRGLLEEDFKRWGIPEVSRETYDFIGQLLEEDRSSREKGLASLGQLLRSGKYLQAAVQALAYCLVAYSNEHPAPTLANIRLDGADMSGWNFLGKQHERLNLRGSIWRGTKLEATVFHNTDLEGAIFDGVSLVRGEFLDCRMQNCTLTNTNLAGAIFRDCDKTGADLTGSHFHRTTWLRSNIHNTKGIPTSTPAAFIAISSPTNAENQIQILNPVIDAYEGLFASACAISPDSRLLATGGQDASVLIFDFESGQCILVLRGHEDDYIEHCTFSPNGLFLASASEDGTIRIWDTANGNCLNVLKGHNDIVMCCAFSPDGLQVASASLDGTARIWDVKSGDCLLEIKAHSDRAFFCSYSPDGRFLATAGRGDSQLSIWYADSGICYTTIQNDVEGVNNCIFSPDGKWLMSTWGDVQIWDSSTGVCLKTLTCEEGANTCSFSHDGNYIAVGGCDGSVWIWDTNTWEITLNLKEATDIITECIFTPDGKHIVIACPDYHISIWDIAENRYLPELFGNEMRVSCCEFSLDNKLLVSGVWNGYLYICDIDNNERISSLKAHDRGLKSVAISPDSLRIASTGYDNLARIWDINSSTCLYTLSAPQAEIIIYSPDGQYLALKTKNPGIQLFYADDGRPFVTLAENTDDILYLAFSHDGMSLASTERSGIIKTWDVRTGKCKATYQGHGCAVTACIFSPDGQSIASGDSSGEIRLWDISGKCRYTINRHDKRINKLMYSEDGKHLSATDSYGSYIILDTHDGRILLSLQESEYHFSECAFSHDGCYLAIASTGILRVIDIDQKKEIRRIFFLADGNWALINTANNQILMASDNAWRWLGWSGIDPATGRMERWPAETFGPLPE